MLPQIFFYIKFVAVSHEPEGPFVISILGVLDEDGDTDFVRFLPFPRHMKKAISRKRGSTEVVGQNRFMQESQCVENRAFPRRVGADKEIEVVQFDFHAAQASKTRCFEF